MPKSMLDEIRQNPVLQQRYREAVARRLREIKSQKINLVMAEFREIPLGFIITQEPSEVVPLPILEFMVTQGRWGEAILRAYDLAIPLDSGLPYRPYR